MKARRPLPRSQRMIAIVMILLALLFVLLWFNDPAHQPTGGSRIGWPEPSPAKP